MSVIFGIKENNRIIIAGDKRGSSIDGKTLSDDLDKVLMINDHLAFSSAGNVSILQKRLKSVLAYRPIQQLLIRNLPITRVS